MKNENISICSPVQFKMIEIIMGQRFVSENDFYKYLRGLKRLTGQTKEELFEELESIDLRMLYFINPESQGLSSDAHIAYRMIYGLLQTNGKINATQYAICVKNLPSKSTAVERIFDSRTLLSQNEEPPTQIHRRGSKPRTAAVSTLGEEENLNEPEEEQEQDFQNRRSGAQTSRRQQGTLGTNPMIGNTQEELFPTQPVRERGNPQRRPAGQQQPQLRRESANGDVVLPWPGNMNAVSSSQLQEHQDDSTNNTFSEWVWDSILKGRVETFEYFAPAYLNLLAHLAIYESTGLEGWGMEYTEGFEKIILFSPTLLQAALLAMTNLIELPLDKEIPERVAGSRKKRVLAKISAAAFTGIATLYFAELDLFKTENPEVKTYITFIAVTSVVIALQMATEKLRSKRREAGSWQGVAQQIKEKIASKFRRQG